MLRSLRPQLRARLKPRRLSSYKKKPTKRKRQFVRLNQTLSLNLALPRSRRLLTQMRTTKMSPKRRRKSSIY